MEFSTLNGYKVKDKKAIRYYDNVSDMKNDTSLKSGMYAKTKGYYTSNDGGHGEYVIINDNELSEDNGLVHTLTNGLKAKLIYESEINVKQYGAKGDGVTNDTLAIQSCLNNCDLVIIPEGEFICNGSLTIKEKQTLKGKNKNKSILRYTGTDSFIINEDVETSSFIIIENLSIYGTNKQGIGICLSRTASVDGYGASWHRLTNLIIGGFETGLEVRKNQNETQFTDIHCRNNINGIRVINGVSDMYFERIVCSRNDTVGIYLFQVTETRFSDLKLWYNGSKTGAYNNLRIDSCNALMFVNLSLQDAFGNNCYITTSNNISMINSWFDTPQNDTSDTCYQLKLKDVNDSTFTLKGRNRKVENVYVNKILQIDGNCERNNISYLCETDFPYSNVLNMTNTAINNNVCMKNSMIINEIVLNYNNNLNYLVNGNLQDKSTLNWINTGKESCTWEGSLVRATSGSSGLTLGFKTGKRDNTGFHTYYIKFSVVSGSGTVTFKNSSVNISNTGDYILSFNAYFDNTNRSNTYLTMNIPSDMVIDISEIGCNYGLSGKFNNPLSLTALS